MKNPRQKLELVMTRDVSLIMTEIWHQVHADMWKIHGFKYSGMIYVYDGKAVKSFRPAKIFEKDLPWHFSRRLKSNYNRRKLLLVFERYLQAYKRIKHIKKHFSAKISADEALKDIKLVKKLILDGLGGLVVIFWILVWKENYPIYEFPARIVAKAKFIREHEARKEAFFDDATDVLDFYLKVISLRKGWSYELLRLMKLSELQAMLSKQMNASFRKIRQRRSGWVYLEKRLFPIKSLRGLLFDRGYEIVSDKESFHGILKGTPAQFGKVKGRIKIIRARREISKFQNGNILVAPMTTPWYLPLMKRAAAFITDEGGMISHAAIISRELKIPCIVGTKIATKVLKDGDLVEVDANEGIVRILKRNK